MENTNTLYDNKDYSLSIRESVAKAKQNQMEGQTKLSNYTLKSELLRNGKFHAYRKLRYYTFKLEVFGNQTFIKAEDYELAKYHINAEEQKVCENLHDAYSKRVIRLKKRIKSILHKYPYVLFITLTFTNEILQKTSQETRRRYVTRYLQLFGGDYVANIDYGKSTEREHYHAVVGYTYLLHEDAEYQWKYGFFNMKHVRNEKLNSERLSKYVAKLTNHAIKETAKGNKIIYAKK